MATSEYRRKRCGKQGCGRLNGKSSGKAEIVTGMFFVIVLALLAASQLQIMSFRTTARYMEDALAASNLASAIMDPAAYGRGEGLRIPPQKAYALYQQALKNNLSLNDAWECENAGLVGGPVEILEYTVYNLSGQDVFITTYGREGERTERIADGKGRIRTPDGCMVERPCVYSRIGFWVEGSWGIRVYACKEKTVDIMAEGEEGEG